ncbi:MAG: SDR family NAD(P)-dependent oxidoreductase [Halieaceae bacterium]|jgi:NAD(P)-dependent dehydrogenase (short-subunit alcohol dehydrogenase family)|nr:SDR family NAD(P)-dependent oxidoreductase [Halieaceae bacterium]
MSKRHALVTGAGTGIGAVIAGALASQGARVSLLGRKLPPLEALASSLGNARAISCDVTDESAVAKAFEEATAKFGPVEILINNAGEAPTAPFHKLTARQWRQVMAVNLDGVFHCSSAAIDGMLELGWGRIVNIASTAALRGYAYVSAYSAAKHGVLGLTRSLALETATKGITVNAVCPGYTDTDIIRRSVRQIMEKTGRSEAQALAGFTAANPQGRLIEPEEIAASVLWLCSEQARSVTGQAISINGGEVM